MSNEISSNKVCNSNGLDYKWFGISTSKMLALWFPIHGAELPIKSVPGWCKPMNMEVRFHLLQCYSRLGGVLNGQENVGYYWSCLIQ